MNADVIVWGPMGVFRRGKGWTQNWKDIDFQEIADAVNWVIEESYREGKGFDDPERRIHFYDGTAFTPPGVTFRTANKGQAGHRTKFYYAIVSDEKIETADQALGLVQEALEGGDTDGT